MQDCKLYRLNIFDINNSSTPPNLKINIEFTDYMRGDKKIPDVSEYQIFFFDNIHIVNTDKFH